jgi:hypothetical protein
MRRRKASRRDEFRDASPRRGHPTPPTTGCVNSSGIRTAAVAVDRSRWEAIVVAKLSLVTIAPCGCGERVNNGNPAPRCNRGTGIDASFGVPQQSRIPGRAGTANTP